MPADIRENEDGSYACVRCGSDCEWNECETCGGDGWDGHDCGEDCCACLRPEDNVICRTCIGAGGWWSCSASPEWCQANPMIGRDAVKRTC